ncbi:MAG: hypothetical protein WA173_06730 [Pseudomonas sp.]|uniref:hypothetical protein n=1 Tax=Pseudomonas sp. TaxID=306 RepID=UPI003BB653F5
MDAYRHHVAGFFPHRDNAESTLATLLEHGIPAAQLLIFVDTGQVPFGAMGTAADNALGDLATVGLATAEVSVFIARPLLAPLMLLGGGASLGFMGAAADHQGRFAELIRTAIKAGDVVLVAETFSAKQTTITRELMDAAVGAYKDLSPA